MDNKLGLLLQIILDKAGQQEAKKGLDETAKSIENVSESLAKAETDQKKWTKAISDQTKAVKEAKKELSDFEKLYKNLITSTDEHSDTVKRIKEEYKSMSNAVSAAEETLEDYKNKQREAKEEAKKYNSEIRDLSKFSGMSVGAFKKLSAEEQNAARNAYQAQQKIEGFNKELQITERRVADLNQLASSIGQISSSLFLGGSAVIGAMYLAANQEAERIKEAGGVVDETTQRWLTAQKRIELSYQRVGRVALSELLPYLEKAAALAEKASKFVERNPDLVKAALNTAGVIATIGAVGMLVSRGIRFVADVTLIGAQLKYAASTAMFKSSVDKFFLASAKSAVGGGGYGWRAAASSGGAGAGVGGMVGIASAVVVGVIASGVVVTLVNQLLEATGVNDRIDDARAQARSQNARIYPGLINDPEQRKIQVELNKAIESGDTAEIERLKGAMDKAIESTKGLTEGLDDLSQYTEAAKADVEGFKIIKDLERDNLEAEREYANDKAKIIEKATEAVTDASNRLQQATSKIKSNLSGTLSKLSANFAKQNQEADIKYQEDRAKIARDGNEEILSIQKNAQEELRKLDEDFALQKDELTRERDALGLAKAQREYERNKDEIDRGKDDEIAERRRQTQIQLAELKHSYEQDRAARLAKYKQDQADAKAQAAQELEQARVDYAQRMAEIQKQKAQELRELAIAYNEERRKRIIAAYEQIKDLGNALNAERALRARYNAIILADTQAFMSTLSSTMKLSGTKTTSAYGGTLGSGMTPVSGTRQSGGYVGDGLYKLHNREYVMSPSTVTAAESLIGSQLTQQALLMALATGRKGSFTVNDGRRFDSSIPLTERRAIAEEGADMALNAFTRLLKG